MRLLPMTMDHRVALVTGATSGIGLALVERLLKDHPNLHVCVTGRNQTKLNSTLQILRTAYPSANLSSILLDVSESSSVLSAVKEMRARHRYEYVDLQLMAINILAYRKDVAPNSKACLPFTYAKRRSGGPSLLKSAKKSRFLRLDFVFLNAGMMPETKIRWLNVIRGFFSGKIVHMLLTGDGMLEAAPDKKTQDGLPATFATNIFGHFMLITELEELLGGYKEEYSQLIWTSSGSALVEAFDENDIICLNGHQPYASSKYCIDALSLTINEWWNKKGIYSHVVCPGTVVTNMTLPLLPQWLWWMRMPVFFFLRVVVRSFTLTLESGISGLVWVAKQNPESINSRLKIFTRATWFGTYLDFKKIDVDDRTKQIIVDHLFQIREEILRQLQSIR